VLRSSRRRVVDLREELAQLRHLALLFEHLVYLRSPRPLGRHAQVRLQDLPDVHARRHAERVENDVHGLSVLVVGHVLDGHDHGDNALVAVTAGHLVTGLDAPLDRQIDLDDLEHAGRQVVATLQLASSCPRSAPRAAYSAPRGCFCAVASASLSSGLSSFSLNHCSRSSSARTFSVSSCPSPVRRR
jgi:hypothetical protein